MDWFDLAEYGDGDATTALGRIALDKALVIGVETDILFPLQQQEQLADGLRAGGADTTFAPLPSPQGHDAFLVDIARFGPVVGNFLAQLQ
jgi:homoserine O-acetyltransferase